MNNKRWKITRDRVEILESDGSLYEVIPFSGSKAKLARDVDISVPVMICALSFPWAYYSPLIWIAICVSSLGCSIADSYLGHPNCINFVDSHGFNTVYNDLDYLDLYEAYNKSKKIHENFINNSKLNLE